jgi:hypothetical protein
LAHQQHYKDINPQLPFAAPGFGVNAFWHLPIKDASRQVSKVFFCQGMQRVAKK